MASLKQAVRIIKAGGVVVYPTESFWALGTDATNRAAVARVFRLKGRGKKPIALIAGSMKQVESFFVLTKAERALARKHWPGAMTLLLRPKRKIAARALAPTTPSRRMAGHPSLEKEGTGWGPRRFMPIGVRVPGHARARQLALSAGVPITATSANISGHLPTKSAAKVKRQFPDILVMVGRCGRARRPSAVIEIRGQRVQVIRRGTMRIDEHV